MSSTSARSGPRHAGPRAPTSDPLRRLRTSTSANSSSTSVPETGPRCREPPRPRGPPVALSAHRGECLAASPGLLECLCLSRLKEHFSHRHRHARRAAPGPPRRRRPARRHAARRARGQKRWSRRPSVPRRGPWAPPRPVAPEVQQRAPPRPAAPEVQQRAPPPGCSAVRSPRRNFCCPCGAVLSLGRGGRARPRGRPRAGAEVSQAASAATSTRPRPRTSGRCAAAAC
mmetsp:Transcript_103910/g.333071  ORF Transcript_103910/g.333071 Transcript_103910/m.333071 type:complete len:229 (+) Transcript_103910:457-1143(+)